MRYSNSARQEDSKEQRDRKGAFVKGGLIYVTYCVYGGRALIFELFLFLVVAALAWR